MKKKRSASDDDMELRSEKVREILGSMPKGLSRLGMAVICVLFLLLVAVMVFVRFPHGEGESILQYVLGR